MGVDDVTDDAEADAAAAHLGIHRAAAAVEGFEDVRQIVPVDAETMIDDANLDLRTASAEALNSSNGAVFQMKRAFRL